ncbi:MAG: endonuclease [Burkholderiales bacterium RIFCSPLOWO2_02_FULL_57_36]|nr:MAG: endonuclease [Burkholderiales bacterium RIFCSPLOWO2_02_FULL_57_36]
MSVLIRGAFALAGFLAVAPSVQAFDPDTSPVAAQGTLQVAFAPWDDIESVIVDAIDAAKTQVLVQAYLLTNRKIAATLIAAHRRGVDVQVLADAEQHARTGSSKLTELAAAGITVRLETKYQNAHNKVIVIDAATSDATLITGSFNFTWTAQHKNAENILVVRKNPQLASRYKLNWERHRQDASPYKK